MRGLSNDVMYGRGMIIITCLCCGWYTVLWTQLCEDWKCGDFWIGRQQVCSHPWRRQCNQRILVLRPQHHSRSNYEYHHFDSSWLVSLTRSSPPLVCWTAALVYIYAPYVTFRWQQETSLVTFAPTYDILPLRKHSLQGRHIACFCSLTHTIELITHSNVLVVLFDINLASPCIWPCRSLYFIFRLSSAQTMSTRMTAIP